MTDIKSSRILIIATNGFEQKDLEVPRDTLRPGCIRHSSFRAACSIPTSFASTRTR